MTECMLTNSQIRSVRKHAPVEREEELHNFVEPRKQFLEFVQNPSLISV